MNTDQILTSLQPHEADEARRVVASLGLDELFKAIDLKEIAKDSGLALVGVLRSKVLPVVRDKFGAVVGLAISAALDQLEAKLNSL
jgi:hypothetical protein